MILYIIFGLFFLFIFYEIFLKEKLKYYLYGIVNLKKSNFEIAIIYLNKAIKENQNSFKSYYALGETYRFLSENKKENGDINKLKSFESYYKAVYYSKIADNHKFLQSSLNRLKLIYYDLDNESKTKSLNNIFRFPHSLHKSTLKSIFKNELSDLLSDYSEIKNFSSNLFFKELEEPIIKYYELNSIKKFDFEKLDSVSFKNFLNKVNVVSLRFIPAKDNLGKETKYLRHWESNERYALIIAKDVFEKISQDANLTIDVKKIIKKSNSGYFTNFILSMHKTNEDYINEMLEENLKNYE